MEKNNGEKNIMEKEQDQKYQEKETARGANCFRLISIRVRSRWIFRVSFSSLA